MEHSTEILYNRTRVYCSAVHRFGSDALLLARHTARKIRQAGGRLRGSAKRKPEQDRAFEEALERLLSESEPK